MPFGGQGANMAILSAVELANLLYDTESVAQEETTRVFKEYYETRHKISQIAVEQSNQNGALIHKRVMYHHTSKLYMLCGKSSTGPRLTNCQLLLFFFLPSHRASLVISPDTCF